MTTAWNLIEKVYKYKHCKLLKLTFPFTSSIKMAEHDILKMPNRVDLLPIKTL